MPFLVPLVIADTMDTGVDITKAHGQEITKVLMLCKSSQLLKLHIILEAI